jgi:very-short-patch-repair endonuclease
LKQSRPVRLIRELRRIDTDAESAKLIIEVDGGQHNEPAMIEEDNQRTKWLESKGFEVMKFWNSDVFENLDGVLEKIHESLTKRIHPHLNPLPHRERRREGDRKENNV